MSEYRIQDGTGKGYLAKVNSYNELTVRAVSELASLESARRGLGTNIVTGVLNLTTANESACIYLKNTSSKYDFILDTLAVGIGKQNGTITNPVWVRAYADPTGGTIITDETPVAINNNRNFGNPVIFSGDVFQGGEGKTFTGGEQTINLFQNQNGRLAAPLAQIIPQNKSIVVTVTPNCSSGCDIYVAFVSYYEETVV